MDGMLWADGPETTGWKSWWLRELPGGVLVSKPESAQITVLVSRPPWGSVERELHKAGREKGDCFQIRPAPTPTPEALRGFQEGHNSFTAYHGPSKVHALRLTWPPALEQVRSRVSPGPSFISPTVMAP